MHTAGLAAVAVAAHRRRRGNGVSAVEWAQLSVATFATSKALTREKIGVWAREPVLREEPLIDGSERSERVRAVGELITCPRCVGAWSSLSLMAVRSAYPVAGQVVTGVFATAGANDFLQAAFRLVCEGSNVVQREADRRREPATRA